MSRRPATITQADIARIIRAAKQAGATEVRVPVNGVEVVVKLSTGDDAPLAPQAEAVM